MIGRKKMSKPVYHCMFEQSGTFKNEFKKLGYEAYDYDILNDYGETDFQIDLFEEIEKAYGGGVSVFDNIGTDDVVLAFFPCVRFESQIYMHFQGTMKSMSKWSDKQKLENVLKLHEELAVMYEKLTKLALLAFNKGFKLIIENPYSPHHYLVRYWPIKPTVIDKDRREMGDYYTKPTQYFFLNCKPTYNFIFEPQVINEKKRVTARVEDNGQSDKVTRSLISKEYANRFIREFVI